MKEGPVFERPFMIYSQNVSTKNEPIFNAKQSFLLSSFSGGREERDKARERTDKERKRKSNLARVRERRKMQMRGALGQFWPFSISLVGCQEKEGDDSVCVLHSNTKRPFFLSHNKWPFSVPPIMLHFAPI